MAKERLERRRYRKTHVRVWGDDKFRALSAAAPNAQTLWFYLMFGPHTGTIPGLSVTGEASLAEGLAWPVPPFRRCLKEIIEQGMAIADWSTRVIWLPNAVNYNEPESPNVVKAWVKALDEIPDCDLKGMAVDKMRAFLGAMPDAFLRSFDDAVIRYHVKTCSKASDKPSGEASTKPSGEASDKPSDKGVPLVGGQGGPLTRGNQISEQIQIHTQKDARVSLADHVAERAARFLERYQQLYQQHRKGARYLLKPARDFAYAEQLCATWPDDRLDPIAVLFLTTDHAFANSGSRTLGQLCAMASWCDNQLTGQTATPPSRVPDADTSRVRREELRREAP